MSFLVDTNLLSELRKGTRCNRGVVSWFEDVPEEEVFLSVITMGEIRRGIERIRRRDRRSARRLEAWLEQIIAAYEARFLPITVEIADCWGRLGVPDPVPPIDGLIAATGLVHDLVVVTRNAKDLERTGVRTLNPFT